MFVYDKIFWTKAISQFNKLKLNGLQKKYFIKILSSIKNYTRKSQKILAI